MQTHIRNKDVEIEELKPGLRRQIMAYDSDLMLVKVYFDTGVEAERHTHMHQQITYVAKGKFDVFIDGEMKVMEAGDTFIIPSDLLHGARCIEARDGIHHRLPAGASIVLRYASREPAI